VTDPARMDDTDFLHHVLSDGEWHGQMDILAESGRVRGCGMTVHSRAASLRARGFTVLNRQHIGPNGRRVSEYRLAGTVQAEESGFISAIGSGLDDGTPLLGPSAAVAVPPIEAGQAGPADLPLEPARQLSVFEAAA
jgi:hypothetical protein